MAKTKGRTRESYAICVSVTKDDARSLDDYARSLAKELRVRRISRSAAIRYAIARALGRDAPGDQPYPA